MRLLAGPTDRFAVSPTAIFERIHDEGVILDTKRELYLALNESGTCIWDALASGETVEGAAQRLADRFQIPRDRAREDVEGLVKELVDHELMHRRG